jgi:hypothetical protein
MMYQTLHGIPIAQGYLARRPPSSLGDGLAYDDLAAQREQLRLAHVKYIVIHKRFLTRETGEVNELNLDRYVQEYGRFYEDGDNLVLRVY